MGTGTNNFRRRATKNFVAIEVIWTILCPTEAKMEILGILFWRFEAQMGIPEKYTVKRIRGGWDSGSTVQIMAVNLAKLTEYLPGKTSIGRCY
jgi:hypothetical protein